MGRAKQGLELPPKALQGREEARLGFGAAQQTRQRRLVADRVGAGIIAPQQADVAGDVTGDHRHAGDDGLGNHVGAALLSGTDHHGPGLGQFAAHPPSRHFAEPPVAGVPGHLGGGLFGEVGGVGLAQVGDPELRFGRQEPGRQGGPERVFLGAQVADDTDFEVPLGRAPRAGQGQGRLAHHMELAAKRARQRLADEVVQADQGVRHLHGAQRLLRVR